LLTLAGGSTRPARKVVLGATVVAAELAPPPGIAVAAAEVASPAAAGPPPATAAPETTAPSRRAAAATHSASIKWVGKSASPTYASAGSVTPSTTSAPRPVHHQSGPASWYDAPKGTCAHQSLPFGTVVTITDTANGRTASCTVDDRGPYLDGRIIDLAPDVFSQLAPTSHGVIDVELSW
jgi:rare lipoprotein A